MSKRSRAAVSNALWLVAPEALKRRRDRPLLYPPTYPLAKRTGVAFVHIPKAAGSAISITLYGEQIGHHKWSAFYRANPLRYPRLLKFSICRDPADRFVSAFKFLKAGGMNEADARFAEDVLKDIGDVNDFALALEDAAFRERALKKVHFHSQFSFVCDPKGRVMVDYLIAFPRLGEDLPKVCPVFEGSGLPKINVGPKAAPADAALSGAARRVVETLYADDFRLYEAAAGADRIYGRNIGAPSN